MSTVLNRPIKILPTESGKGIEVEVKEMTLEHVWFWSKHVQPLINKHYSHAKNGVESTSVRADVGWSWWKYFLMAVAHTGSSFVPGVKSGTARALVIVIKNKAGKEIPLGMLTVVPEFYCNVHAAEKVRTFAWYLADAPSELYKLVNLETVRRVASSLLDTAIQTGIDRGLTGELLLHADENGGDKLKEFYEYCGMVELGIDAPPVSILRWQGPDRYFYFDENSSKKFCSKFDQLR